MPISWIVIFTPFSLNVTATTEFYTLSLHDALPICVTERVGPSPDRRRAQPIRFKNRFVDRRSEEHTSELQSRRDLVCRLLLEKKKESRQKVSRLLARGAEIDAGNPAGSKPLLTGGP